MGNTTQNWIGKSQYGDPGLNGTVDEFQIYDRALSQAEIQALTTSPDGGGWPARSPGTRSTRPAARPRSTRRATGATRAWTPRWSATPARCSSSATSPATRWCRGRTSRTSRRSPRAWCRTPTSTSRRCATTPTGASSRSCRSTRPTSATRPRRRPAATTSRTSTRRCRRSCTRRRCASTRRRTSPPDMYRLLLEWLTWVQYVGGDNRYPDNNEFFFNWNPATRTLGRSGIHHNILGAYNFMIIDDIAGVRPRLDDVLELWPIDVGYDHFAVNNLQLPRPRPDRGLGQAGRRPPLLPGRARGLLGLPRRPAGVHRGRSRPRVVERPDRRGVSVLDGSDTRVLFQVPPGDLPGATDISLSDNDAGRRHVPEGRRRPDAGVRLAAQPGPGQGGHRLVHHDRRRTCGPPRRRTRVDGFTISGLPIQQGTYLARNTIWGTQGSPNAQDWLEVDLGAPTTFNTVKLYFFSDKTYKTQSNGVGQHLPPTVGLHAPVPRRDRLGRRRRTRSARRRRRCPTTTRCAFAPLTAQRIRVAGDTDVRIRRRASRRFRSSTRSGATARSAGCTSGALNVDRRRHLPGRRRVGHRTGAGARRAPASSRTGAIVLGPLSGRPAPALVQLLDSSVVGPVSISRHHGPGGAGRHRGWSGRSGSSATSPAATPIVVTGNDVIGPLACSGNESGAGQLRPAQLGHRPGHRSVRPALIRVDAGAPYKQFLLNRGPLLTPRRW